MQDRVSAAVGAHAEVEGGGLVEGVIEGGVGGGLVEWSAGAGDEGDEGLREVWRLWRAASGRWARSKTPVS